MKDQQTGVPDQTAASPIKNKVGTIFIPVSDIEKARDWYCRLLGLKPEDCQMWHGHLCGLPMEGAGIILDTMPMWDGKNPDGPPIFKTPAFFFLTEDLTRSFEYVKQLGIEIETEIQNDKWFVVKDPDGNLFMICGE